MTRSAMMPGAHRVAVPARYQQRMGGEHGTKSAVLHAEGVLVHNRDGRDLIRWMNEHGVGSYSGTFVPYGKYAGQWCWSIPVTKGASALVGNASRYGQSLNRQGKLRPQVCLAGVVSNMDFEKMTKHAVKRWIDGLRWLESWGIPAVPLSRNWGHGAPRVSYSTFVHRSGWLSHGQAPSQGPSWHTDGSGQDWHDLLMQPR